MGDPGKWSPPHEETVAVETMENPVVAMGLGVDFHLDPTAYWIWLSALLPWRVPAPSGIAEDWQFQRRQSANAALSVRSFGPVILIAADLCPAALRRQQ